VSGRNGVILKTTNGGINWFIQNNGLTGRSMYGIYAVDSNIVYCIGWFETILKTTNGGNNWSIIRYGIYAQSHSFFGTYFLNENTGWICGTGSLIFKTTNGGLTFDSTFIPVGYLYDIYFRNPLEGLVCGEASTMYRTTDGGLNWTQIIMPIGTAAADFFKMSFINLSTGYTQGVTTNKVFKTTNFGISWDSIARVPGADESYCIFFPSLNTGYCAGTYGRMFKTTNGGYNWRQENLLKFNTAFINSLYFYNDSIGWAVGGAGKILFTSNGGQPLVQISNNNELIPNTYQLFQNYPNPFNSQTRIDFEILNRAFVNITVYDLRGKEVQSLVNDEKTTGRYSVNFNAQNISSGIYFTRMSVNGKSQKIIKMTLIK
jgi:photosystem II stability/assembly factor-like uncharacterized protein